MKYKVKVIKKCPGYELGGEKNLAFDIAKHLEKKGIVKILGEVPNVASTIKKVESVATDLESMKDMRESIELLLEEDKSKSEKIVGLEKQLTELSAEVAKIKQSMEVIKK